MTPISTSAESVRSFIDQMGVATSGDALAVLRCLSLNINAAMSGAVSAQDDTLQSQILRLDRIQQSRVAERLAQGQRIEGYMAWSVEEAHSLQAVVSELKLSNGVGFGPFEPLVSYQRQVTAADGSVVNEEGATTAERFSDWLTDYERSVNAQGQVVWTHVGGADGEPRETIVFTELDTLLGVPAPQVDGLQRQIAQDTAAIVAELATAVNMLRFTLEEWWGDVRIDDRWHLFARHNEDQRTERRLDGMREEADRLRTQLQSLGHEWPTLAQALAALQMIDGETPSASSQTEEAVPPAEPKRSASHGL